MTKTEEEILDFYRMGYPVALISEVYVISISRLTKMLEKEPKLQPSGFQWRKLFPSKKPD